MPDALFKATLHDGIALYCSGDYCLLQNPNHWQVLSSAPLNGGFYRCQNLLNLKVSGELSQLTPAQSLEQHLESLGVLGESVAMMTAASMKSMRFVQKQQSGIGFTAIVTTGLSNARRAGDKADELIKPGTINLQVISHQRLQQAAMVEAIAMATEAKACALQNKNIFSKVSTGIATGTGTDCTLIACPEKGEALEYVGKHTLAGESLAKACIEALEASLVWYD